MTIAMNNSFERFHNKMPTICINKNMRLERNIIKRDEKSV